MGRQRRIVDARKQLRAAHDLFSDFGMEAYAERARVELEATGEHVGRRPVDSLGQLTPQEAQISRLVADGNTNREIAAQLFISPSTVEYHLRKAFRKARCEVTHAACPPHLVGPPAGERKRPMPMIDVYAAAGPFGDQHALAQKLATELMTIEQVPDIPMFRKNTAAFVHELPPSSLSNVDGNTTYVRVQVLTNAGALGGSPTMDVVPLFRPLT
jgi:DNA-binding CsgD family transcriptional regulator